MVLSKYASSKKNCTDPSGMKQANRTLTIFHYIRMALIGASMVALLTWERFPMLHLVALVAVAAEVVVELAYMVYLMRGFQRVVATVELEGEVKGEDGMPTSLYMLRYQYNGEEQACRYGDTILSNTFAGATHCRLMIDKSDQRVILIDDFRRRYLNLIFAVLMLASVMSFYGIFGAGAFGQ